MAAVVAKASKSVGTTIKMGEQQIGGLKEIGGLELSADTIDVTTLDNTTGYKDFIGGWKDSGEVSLSGFFDGTATVGQAEMLAAFDSGEQKEFTITFPAATKASWTFNGVVTGFKTSVSVDDAISFEATIKVAGKATLTVTTT